MPIDRLIINSPTLFGRFMRCSSIMILNAYQDLGIEDADARQLKALLAAEIIKTLDRRKLSVHKAHALTGIDAADSSRIRNADFRRMTVERLMAIVNRLGSRIEFKIRLHPVSATSRFSSLP